MYDSALEYLQTRTSVRPQVAVVLGSGLGGFAEELEDRIEIPYAEIPNWPRSTAVGHAGKLVLGKLGQREVAVLSGRAHLYEGYTPAQSVFGVRVMGKFGVRGMIFTNAAGGINLAFQQSALVLISDHINLQGSNPLAGPNDDSLGPRFPDMSEAYSERYRRIAREAEVIAANHMGIRVLGLSCVTNMAAGLQTGKISHDEVLETGGKVRETLTRLLKTVVPQLEV